MAAIIIERENHPDGCIERAIGPYPDWETAHSAAQDLEKSSYNTSGYRSRRYDYIAMSLTPPEEA